MTLNSIEKAQAFKIQVIDKIQKLLNEYASGELNRDQFDVLYERYSGQLALAQQALESGDVLLSAQHADSQSTIAIKNEHMGKAMGMVIYQNKNGACIETLGDIEVSAFVISPVLNEFSLLMEAGKEIEPRVVKLEEKRWVLFTGGSYSTVVTLFHNEPSPQQTREIKRLHHDFETANKGMLEKGKLDSKKLAYPFIVFVQQKLKKPSAPV